MSASEELWMLMSLALTVGVLHSLNPDHWLPFVMLGRSRNWTSQRTLGLAGLAGTAHVGTSIIIGLIGIALGAVLAERFATVIEYITGALLILFGFSFAYLSWKRRGHHHHGIPFIARLFGKSVDEAEKWMHTHRTENGSVFQHSHKYEREAEHTHEHSHDHEHNQFDGKMNNTRAGYGLVAIIGLTPCVALLPIVFAATASGTSSVVAVMIIFLAATLATIMLTTTLALKGLQLVKLEFFEKHGEVITGLVIALMGILIVSLGL
ncbi:hypothetical protein ACFLTN_05080 [Chloroflexota bacterium]